MNDRAFATRLSERAAVANLVVSPEQVEKLEGYYRLLERWNRRINLTALPLDRYPPEAIDRLIIEPLAAAWHVDNAPLDWVDLGSGGGSPAIPLKIVRPRLRLLMTESRGRKAAFLREAVRLLGLKDSEVSDGRFEALADGAPGTADLVTARGVKVDRALAALVRHVLKPDGRLLLFGYRDFPWLLSSFDILHCGTVPGAGSYFALLARQ